MNLPHSILSRSKVTMTRSGAMVDADRTKWQRLFAKLWQHAGGPKLHAEVQFHPTRKWRFDFIVDGMFVAFELHGQHHQRAGHSTGRGIERDREKALEAWLMGWTVIELVAPQITPSNVSRIIARLSLAPTKGKQ